MIVFSPHPDDAALGCGGTIAKRMSGGFQVFIVMMTDGRHAFSRIGIFSEPSPEEVKQIRKEESIEATKILGVPEKNLFFFDFEDGTLEKHEKEATEKAVEVIKKHWPADIYYPFRRDTHPDHRATNRIVRRALHQLRFTGSYEYTITHTSARVGPVIEGLISLSKGNRVEVDTSEFLDLKEKALKAYKSTMTIISSKQEKPLHPSVDRFLKRREVFYRSD
jgi:LmbE family N-acetylglucosaminyl deacetylase